MTNEKREKYSLKDKSFAAIEEDFMQTTAHRLSYSERWLLAIIRMLAMKDKNLAEISYKVAVKHAFIGTKDTYYLVLRNLLDTRLIGIASKPAGSRGAIVWVEDYGKPARAKDCGWRPQLPNSVLRDRKQRPVGQDTSVLRGRTQKDGNGRFTAVSEVASLSLAKRTREIIDRCQRLEQPTKPVDGRHLHLVYMDSTVLDGDTGEVILPGGSEAESSPASRNGVERRGEIISAAEPLVA